MGDLQQLVMLYLDLEDRSASVPSCTDEQPDTAAVSAAPTVRSV